MRSGKNPHKYALARHAAPLTDPRAVGRSAVLTTVTCFPHTHGYYREWRRLLTLTFGSLWQSTGGQYPILVFDNASCPEVRGFLGELQGRGVISLLMLSERNVGKLAGLNALLSAAGSCDYVAYADSDFFFKAGWLEESVKVLDSFPSVGLVCSCPVLRFPEPGSWELANMPEGPGVVLERGRFVAREYVEQMGRDLGKDSAAYVAAKLDAEQIRLTSGGVSCYWSAWHAQFVVRRDLIRAVFPLPRGFLAETTKEAELDKRIVAAGFGRVSTVKGCVRHLGNIVEGAWDEELARCSEQLELAPASPGSPRHGGAGVRLLQRMADLKPLRVVLMGVYDFLFRVLFLPREGR